MPLSLLQLLSCVRLFATPWTAAHQASLSITISRNSLKLTTIESVIPSNHLILCRPRLLLPPIPPSIRVFSNESTLCMRCPEYWSFSFSIIPAKEIPGLIFRMDWLYLLAVQGTLKSLPQHQSSKTSILLHSAFIIVQLSHPYMTTEKTIALTRCTFVSKVLSLLFNVLSRLVIAFLPRSKCLLISWLQSPSAVIFSSVQFSSVHSFSRVWLFATPWTAAHQASLSITNSWSLLRLMSIKSVMPSNQLILCRPLLLLPSIFPNIRVFSNEWVLCVGG